MLNSIGLTLSGMVFITFIAAIYFTKKKYKSLENSIYRFLLITTMVLLVLELVCVYTMSIRDKIPIINEFLCRLYILGDVVWFVVIIGYVKSLSVDKKYDNPLDFFQEKKMLMLIVFATIMFLISCFLEIKFTSGSDNQFYVIGGPAVYSLYVIFVFVGVYMLFVLLKDISRDNAVKRVPVILFLKTSPGTIGGLGVVSSSFAVCGVVLNAIFSHNLIGNSQLGIQLQNLVIEHTAELSLIGFVKGG